MSDGSLKLDPPVAPALEPPRLGLVRGSGAVAARTEGAVAWLLVEGGSGSLRIGGRTQDISARGDVFDGPGWSALVGDGGEVSLEGDARWTIVWRRGEGADSRLIAPDEVVEARRGEGPNARTVRTYLPEGEIIAGETINEPGGWSSYPPHRHEHEEVYLYRFDHPGGFGVAIEYDEECDRARRVFDGTVQRIEGGYHPVVAAPGYTMAYVWALGGSSPHLQPELDPAHARLA